MPTLVFLEHHEGELQKGPLGVLAKAASLGDGEVAGTIVGAGAAGLAAEAGRHGAAKVWVAEDAALEAPLPQPRVDVLAKVVETGGYDTVLFAASVLASDVAAGLAARLDAGLNWDLVDLGREGGRLVGKRPALGDTVVADVGWKGTPAIGIVRSGTFEPAERGGEAEVVQAPVELEDFSTRATMLEQAHEEQAGPVDRGRGRDRRRRPRARRAGELRARRGPGQGARRRGRGDPRGRRCRLVPVLRPGRPDRQERLAEAVRRVRHLGRDPAQGRDAGLERDRRRSTRTPTRRSSSSATSASSGTCTRCCRS